MDDMLKIRRQAKTNCEEATMVNVWCSLYDKIDVWCVTDCEEIRIRIKLHVKLFIPNWRSNTICINTINGSTYDLTQQENFKSCHDSVWLPDEGKVLLAEHTNNGVHVKSQQSITFVMKYC